MNRCLTAQTSYPTANAAWRVIQFLTSNAALHTHKHNAKPGSHAYRCQECGQWHITSRRREPVRTRRWQWQEEARG